MISIMSITFEVIDRFVLVTYSGPITGEKYLNAWKDFYAGDQWVPGMNELNDLRSAELDDQLSAELHSPANKEIRATLDYDTEIHRKHGKPFKVAILAPKTLKYGVATVYSNLNKNPLVETRMFQDIKEAVNWVM